MRPCIPICLSLIAAAFVVQPAVAQSTITNHSARSTAQISQDIVVRALPEIREGGARWIKENDCLSCHRVSFQVWSLHRAQELGFESDHRQLQEWNDWATNWQNMVKPHLRNDASMENVLVRNSDTMAQLLLGRPRPPEGKPEPDWVATYGDHLLKAQQEDGSWKPGGQLPKQKRAVRETQEVTTMWVQLALHDIDIASDELKRAAVRARNWMDHETKGQSTEWWATRLMLARTVHNDTVADELRAMLLGHQHTDGGWGWLVNDESDALGTGIALYALARDGLTLEDSSVIRAVEFLRETQNDDGTWDVKGTKGSDKDTVVDTASYWGATWVTIGLLEFQQPFSSTPPATVSILGSPSIPREPGAKYTRSLNDFFVAPVPKILTAFATNSATQMDQFKLRIRPLLRRHCIECHEPGESQSIDFLSALTEADVVSHREIFANVANELKMLRMPPKNFDQPSDVDRKLLVDWLTTKLDLKPSDTARIAPYVVEVYEDRNGHLWLGTMGKGAACYDGHKLTWFSSKDGLPSNAAHSFAEDKDGMLWVGTHGGAARFDGKKFLKVGSEQGLPKAGRPGPESSAGVQADTEKNIWVSTSTGLFRLDGSKFAKFKVPVAKEKITSYAITAGRLSLRLEDSEGNQWFSTDGYGAIRFDGKSFVRFSKADGLCSNNVNSIVEDRDGNIWFACMQSYQPKMTGDGGVCRYNGRTFTKFSNIRGLSNNDIYTIYKVRSGDIWIGAPRVGAYRYDGKSFTLFEKTDRTFWTRNFGVQDILESRNGTLWFGFSGGLFRFDGTSFYNITEDGPWEKLADAVTTAAAGGKLDTRDNGNR